MSTRPYIVTDAVIVTPEGRFRGYLAVTPPLIDAMGEGTPPAELLKERDVIDAAGALLMAGAIDTHVHFRDPGLTRKASILSESASATAGGVTSYLDMPNTAPPAVTMQAIADKKEIARRTSSANYGFFLGATNSNLNEILWADPTLIPGVKLFMGSSTGDMLVDSAKTIASLFHRYKGVIAVHAEDEAVIARCRARLREAFGDNASVSLHAMLRPAEACTEATRRAVRMAIENGSRLHVCHISTAAELQNFSPGPMAGKRITAETCPHYLYFPENNSTAKANDDGSESPDRLRKCNPAIKSTADRDALRRALTEGTIDTIATDHAPHELADKQGSLWKAASGMPGVRFLMPLMLELTHNVCGLTAERVVELTSANPAALYSIRRRGRLRPGFYADFIIVRPDDRLRPITPEMAYSHLPAEMRPGCRWTPYAGVATRYLDITTYVNGLRACDPQGVSPEASGRAMPLEFGPEP